MSERKPDQLDHMLAKLERARELERDLWPEIASRLNDDLAHASRVPRRAPRFPQRFGTARLWQLAAVLLLMVASSAITYLLTQRALQGELLQARQEVMQQMQPVLSVMPASFAYQRLGTEYARAHAELDAPFERYLQTLPLAERTKIEGSLADLRSAARDLAARLAEHPSDPLLQELLLSTYQNELGLLTRVTDLGAASDLGADL